MTAAVRALMATSALALCLLPALAAAQTREADEPAQSHEPAEEAPSPFAFRWDPRSGDAWSDRQLADINDYAARYRDAFVDELVRYYDAPRELVESLLQQRWAPGDVFYACAVAHVTARPCRAVASAWAQDHGDGWAAVAERMGVTPRSPEARRLKQSFVRSYQRWARPLELDAELRRAFPDHGKAAKADQASAPSQRR